MGHYTIVKLPPPNNGKTYCSKYAKIWDALDDYDFDEWFCVAMPRDATNVRALLSSARYFAKCKNFGINAKVQKSKSAIEIYFRKFEVIQDTR